VVEAFLKAGFDAPVQNANGKYTPAKWSPERCFTYVSGLELILGAKVGWKGKPGFVEHYLASGDEKMLKKALAEARKNKKKKVNVGFMEALWKDRHKCFGIAGRQVLVETYLENWQKARDAFEPPEEAGADEDDEE